MKPIYGWKDFVPPVGLKHGTSRPALNLLSYLSSILICPVIVPPLSVIFFQVPIRWILEDNANIRFLISKSKHIYGVLARGHNIYFHGEMMKIIPQLSLLPILIWSFEFQVTINFVAD